MEISTLVDALMSHDALGARQWVADAARQSMRWTEVPRPSRLSADKMALAAGIVELLAERAGQAAPEWTAAVSASPQKIFLVRSAESMPRLRRLCEEEGPIPLRRRQILAPPEFLTLA